MLEMDDPEHRVYRSALNPYLSPAAIARWEPFVDEITRASIDEKIESGHIDFVDDLANVVPAVLTMAIAGHPAEELVDVQRARTPCGDLHPGTLPGRRAGGRTAPRDGYRPGHHG